MSEGLPSDYPFHAKNLSHATNLKLGEHQTRVLPSLELDPISEVQVVTDTIQKTRRSFRNYTYDQARMTGNFLLRIASSNHRARISRTTESHK